MNNLSYSNSPKRPDQIVRITSKEAYFEYQASGKPLMEWQLTANALKGKKQATRKMLSEATGLPINHITRCVQILLKKGIAVELPDKRPCQATGKKAFYLTINESNQDEK